MCTVDVAHGLFNAITVPEKETCKNNIRNASVRTKRANYHWISDAG